MIDDRVEHSGFGQGDRQAVDEEAFGTKAVGVSVDGTVLSDPVVRRLAQRAIEGWDHLEKGWMGGSLPDQVKMARRDSVMRNLEHVIERGYRRALYAALNSELFDTAPSDASSTHDSSVETLALKVAILQDEAACRIDALVSSLVTDLLTSGFSASFLRLRGDAASDRIEKALRPAAVEPPIEGTATDKTYDESYEKKVVGVDEAREVLGEFLERLERPPEDTEVVIKAKASKPFWLDWSKFSAAPASETRSVVLPGNFKERWPRNKSRTDFDSEDAALRFLHWTVKAHDRVHAARLAYQQFERVSDAICFAVSGVKPAQLNAVGTIRRGDATLLEVVTPKDAEFVFRPLRNSLADARGRRPSLAGVNLEAPARDVALRRLTGALRAQRIARDEHWLESSVTTLWTAVETLAHERYGGSIIDAVVRSVVPFVAGTKIRDLTEDLAVYLQWSGVADWPPFQKTFESLFVGDSIDHVALVITLGQHSQAELLAGMVEDSPLLAFRVRRYHAVAKTTKAAAMRTAQTAKRVDWQLRRVYRLRNGIVHGAHFGGTGEQLLEHLDSYVSAVLGPLSQILEADNGIDSIERATAAVDVEFETWRQWALGRKDATVLQRDEAARLLMAPYDTLIGTRS